MTFSVDRAALVLLSGILVAGCGPSSRSSSSGAAGDVPGAAASTLVGSSGGRTLRVEVDHVDGRAPDGVALELLRQRLAERTDHARIEVVIDDVFAPTGRDLHTIDDLRALAFAHRDGHEGVIHVMYLDGAADPSLGDHLLGVAFGATSLALFPDAISSAVGGPGLRALEVERWTLVHEAGHLLGLVNLGAPQVIVHESAWSRGHCDQPGCVMRFSADERATDFCPRCKDDLRVIGGL